MQIENIQTSIKCKRYFSSDMLLYLQVLQRDNCGIGSIKNCHQRSLRLHQTQERVSEVKLSQDCEEKFKVLEK